MARKKTDEQILREIRDDLLRSLGFEPTKRGRPRGATGTLTIYKANGKYYRHKKNAEAVSANPKKINLDAEYSLEAFETEGFEYTLEDMTHDEYIQALKKAVSAYYGGK